MRIVELITLVASAAAASGASLQLVERFGLMNPTNLTMQIYVPEKLAQDQPSVLFALHGCGMTGEMLYKSNRLPEYADKYGFILVYPSTPNMDRCWGVHDPETLTHGGAGDSQGILSMANYLIHQYNANWARFFVMGVSSGGMMSNVLAAVYPELISGAAVFSGVPHACFAGAPAASPASANQTCAEGKMTHTPQEWGDFVRNSYPDYPLGKPKIQIWHGLADTYVHYNNFYETMKQWSNVLGLELTSNVTGVPSENYTEVVYGDGTKLVGYLGKGVGHIVPVQEEPMLKFFGLM